MSIECRSRWRSDQRWSAPVQLFPPGQSGRPESNCQSSTLGNIQVCGLHHINEHVSWTRFTCSGSALLSTSKLLGDPLNASVSILHNRSFHRNFQVRMFSSPIFSGCRTNRSRGKRLFNRLLVATTQNHGVGSLGQFSGSV